MVGESDKYPFNVARNADGDERRGPNPALLAWFP